MAILDKLSTLLAKSKERIKPVVANVERILSPVTEFTRANPLVSGIALGTAAGVGGTVAASKIKSSRTKKKTKKKKTSTKRKKKRNKRKTTHRKTKTRRRRRRQKQPYTAGKGRDGSTRRIRYTKNNQPYIILKSGKARFIKKSSVRRARKRKGGRY